jgi:hypothetical protein
MGLLQIAKVATRHMLHAPNGRAGGLRQRSLRAGTIAGWQDDLAFAALRDAYEAAGGIARGDVVSRLRAVHGRSTFINVAQLLAPEDIFGFEWAGSPWVPMFQFEPCDMTLRPAPCQVRAELGAEFDGWSVCAWFVEPNAWLARRRPLDLLGSDLEAVLRAARADHLVGADD